MDPAGKGTFHVLYHDRVLLKNARTLFRGSVDSKPGLYHSRQCVPFPVVLFLESVRFIFVLFSRIRLQEKFLLIKIFHELGDLFQHLFRIWPFRNYPVSARLACL